ncbi:MAG: TIGR02757 family protein [Cloacibacterium sp.]|jgi:uncharacterized protein (TIGR02757 family)|nr:TIGR02757 family protein [Cloacibacterium sp.]
MNEKEIFAFLDEKAHEFNVPNYIDSDPLQIPHRFQLRQDVEISAFFSASIAWGNRKSIIKDAEKIMSIMGDNPYDFVMNASERHFKDVVNTSVHRTFNGEDFKFFVLRLRRIYTKYESLEKLFLLRDNESNFYHSLHRFREEFIRDQPHRSHKHVSSSYKNSACKRLMMFLRWMVRKDNKGVDLGIWKEIDAQYLSCPLDVHSGNIARKLGILTRKQNDWKAVEELDILLRKYNTQDPALYDFALFGLGALEKF